MASVHAGRSIGTGPPKQCGDCRFAWKATVSSGAGGLTEHLTKGISRADLKELGEELDAGSAAVIVLGESKIEEQLEQATKRANKLIEKEVDGDADELEREIDAAAKEGATT